MMTPNCIEPTAAFGQAWRDEEAARGVKLVKFFTPAPRRNSTPAEAFSAMLEAMTGSDELQRMVGARERYNERVRQEMAEYYATGKAYYRGTE